MARRAEGWKLSLDERTGIFRVRFTHEGRRIKLSTGERDPGKAQAAATRLYAETVSGRRVVQVAPGQGAPLDTTGARWIMSLDDTRDPLTVRQYETYCHYFVEHFETLDRVTTAGADDYARARLRLVRRKTVLKELSALRGLLRWCEDQQLLVDVPTIRNPPQTATGTRATKSNPKPAPVDLTPDEVEAVLQALPIMAKGGPRGAAFPVRARFVVASETSLRPATLDVITAPGDYARGRATLTVRDEVDKARFGREVPLTERARHALDEVCPDAGPIFGKHDYREYVKAAGVAAKLAPEKAARLSPYDFRHNRITHLAETAPNLPGIAFLAGHRHLTTTNRYLRGSQRAAREVLAASGGFRPHSGPTEGAETKNGAPREAPSPVGGAKGGGRTPTGFSPQDPERGGVVRSARGSRESARQGASGSVGEGRHSGPRGQNSGPVDLEALARAVLAGEGGAAEALAQAILALLGE